MKNALFLTAVLISLIGQAQQNSFGIEFNTDFNSKIENEYTSEKQTVQTSQDYQFITVSAYTFNKSEDAQLYYRTSRDGKWSVWEELEEDLESQTHDRKTYHFKHIFDTIDTIQFKADKPTIETIIFRLFFSIEDDISSIIVEKEILNCDLPSYCDRLCWCPLGNCPAQTDPLYTDPTHIIVHHSAVNYSPGTNYAGVVRSYWDYHVNTNGWSDIGYNWLVDPNGVIYEGRGDSVQGAHFSCMNSGTMGVCVIGDFETATPTYESITALDDLIAWEATDKEIDVLVTSYHEASELYLYGISGHKDANSSTQGCPSGTLCPGENLYILLPDIRYDVSQYPCYMSAGVSDSIDFTSSLKIYPNPTSEYIYIENTGGSEIKQISIYNCLGNKIKTIYNIKNKINITEFHSGFYYLRVFDSLNRTASIKLIKK